MYSAHLCWCWLNSISPKRANDILYVFASKIVNKKITTFAFIERKRKKPKERILMKLSWIRSDIRFHQEKITDYFYKSIEIASFNLYLLSSINTNYTEYNNGAQIRRFTLIASKQIQENKQNLLCKNQMDE